VRSSRREAGSTCIGGFLYITDSAGVLYKIDGTSGDRGVAGRVGGATAGEVGSMTSGTKPGGHTAKSSPTSRKGRAERALRHAADLAPTIKGIQAAG
jgi:hypothetical protein